MEDSLSGRRKIVYQPSWTCPTLLSPWYYTCVSYSTPENGSWGWFEGRL